MTESGARQEFVRPDAARIVYDVAGDGPPVIFLHGLTSRRQGWEPVTSLLAPVFTCTRIDLRGHGESSMASDYSLPLIAGDVRAVADELGLEAPAVVGNSFGATVAAVYAAANPVRAVVCAGNSRLRRGQRSAPARDRSAAAVPARIAADPPRFAERVHAFLA